MFYFAIALQILVVILAFVRSSVSEKVSMIVWVIYMFLGLLMSDTNLTDPSEITQVIIHIVISLVLVIIVMIGCRGQKGSLWKVHGLSLCALFGFLVFLAQHLNFLRLTMG